MFLQAFCATERVVFHQRFPRKLLFTMLYVIALNAFFQLRGIVQRPILCASRSILCVLRSVLYEPGPIPNASRSILRRKGPFFPDQGPFITLQGPFVQSWTCISHLRPSPCCDQHAIFDKIRQTISNSDKTGYNGGEVMMC